VAIVAADVDGIADTGGRLAVGITLGTDFADGGVDWAVSDCGVAWVEGNTGGAGSAGVMPSADRATSELSAAAGASFFHQASFSGIWAQRGPDWQPATAIAVKAIQTKRSG
jgi:hypothetical protein